MTDLITAEDAKKLLDECDSDGCLTCEYARSVIALHAQLADAQAAQAMVTKRCAEEADRRYAAGEMGNPGHHIRALAPIDGLALVQELRAERDALKKKLISPDPYEDTAHPDDHAVNRFAAVMKGKLAAKRLQGRGGWQEPEVPNGYLSRMLREHADKGDPVDVANLAMMIHQRGERIAPQNEGASCKAIDDAIAERDRLAAANAVLEAKAAGLRDFIDEFAKAKIDALRYSPPPGSSPEDEPDPVVDAETVWAWQADARAALATALVVSEAGGATSAATTPQPGEVPASSAPAPALASGKPGEAGE